MAKVGHDPYDTHFCTHLRCVTVFLSIDPCGRACSFPLFLTRRHVFVVLHAILVCSLEWCTNLLGIRQCSGVRKSCELLDQRTSLTASKSSSAHVIICIMCSQNMSGWQSKCWSPPNVWDDVSCLEKLLLDCSAGSQQTAGMLPRNFRVMTKVKLDPLLQLVKALRRVENQVGCHVTLERAVTRRTKEKCTKRLGFQFER